MTMRLATAPTSNIAEFIRLFTSHEMRLRAFAFSLVPHWDDAEEVLQQANLVLWQKFDQFTPGTSFFSWACKVIHLTAKDFRKRQSRQKVRFSDEFLELVAEQTEDLRDGLAERERLLTSCMQKLKEKHRTMLHLRYQQSCSIQHVAAALGSSTKAIYQALSRVHKALYDCVERGLRSTGYA